MLLQLFFSTVNGSGNVSLYWSCVTKLYLRIVIRLLRLRDTHYRGGFRILLRGVLVNGNGIYIVRSIMSMQSMLMLGESGGMPPRKI